MLIIRSAQVAALDAAVLAGFRRRLLAHVRQTLPGRAAQDDDGLLAEIDSAIGQARALGLETERDVARFVDLALGVGPDFVDQPATAWVREVLGDRRRPGSGRLDAVYDRLERERPDLTSVWEAWR
jgi:hypothetical protein